MNRRPKIAVLAVAATLACAYAGGVAGAQVPAAERTSNAPTRATLTTFVKANLEKAVGKDPKAAKEGRDLLLAELMAPNAGGAYKDTYAQVLSTELVALLGSADVHARLVASLIAGRAAGVLSHDNAQLAPALEKALGDKVAGVALHGVKGAKGALAYQLAQPGGKPTLFAAVGAAVAGHASDGNIAKEASDALVLSDLPNLDKLSTPVLAQMTPAVMQMLDARAELFKSGLPDEWDVDRDFVNFFTRPNVKFQSLPTASQADVLQRSLDMLFAQTAAAAADEANSRVIDIGAVKMGRGIYSLLGTLNDAKVAGATGALTAGEFFKTASMTVPPAAADIEAGGDKIVAAVKGMKGFETVKRSEITIGAKATTQPAR